MANRNYSVSVSTLQAKTLLALVSALIFPAVVNSSFIAVSAVSVVNDAINRFPAVFSVSDFSLFLSFTQSAIAKKAYKEGVINLYDFVALYAKEKQQVWQERKDKGFFGDLLEVLIRIILINSINLVHANALSVAEFKRIDIVSKRYGKVEVGHNGKTWSNGTMIDYMAGDYTSVIYGVFSDIDKDLIINLCANGELEKALQEVKKRCAYWADKYDFLRDYNRLSLTGKPVRNMTVKSGKVMTQYNDGIYFRFLEKIETGEFTTL